MGLINLVFMWAVIKEAGEKHGIKKISKRRFSNYWQLD